MKLGRLHIEFWRKNGKIAWVPFEYLSPKNGGAICGCYLLTILGLCFEYMGDECFFNLKKDVKKKKLVRKSKKRKTKKK